MNDYLVSVFLGVIEGLTEFLPVSSTAHLRVSEALLGIDLSDGYWKMFAIIIQMGAILCLPLYFWGRIADFLVTFPGGAHGDRSVITHPLTLTFIAFFCTAVPSYFLVPLIASHLEDLILMGIALIVGGMIMWEVDVALGSTGGSFVAGPAQEMDHMSPGQAIWIGLSQALSAIFPGTSRSMATIAAGQIAGLSRSAAVEFSFLLSIPTMVAATGYDLVKSIKASPEASARGIQFNAHGWLVLALGFLVSFVVAFGVVAWFMQWVRRRGLKVFAVYRILVGAGILIWALRAAI